jgi:hypothetical protein
MAIGQLPHRATIANVTNAYPCVITTNEVNGYSTNDFIRITGLNGFIPTPRGEDPLNNNKYRIVTVDDYSFKLQNAITFKYIDSTNFPPYVEGGDVNLVEDTFYFYGEA